MTTSAAPSDILHQERFNIELSVTPNEDFQPSHSLKDNNIESSSQDLRSSHLVKGTNISLLESSPAPPDLLKNDMLLQPPHTFLEDDLQEPQELFHNVLGPQTPQDLLLNDPEPRTQELLLHDMQPPHGQNFPTQPQEQLQEGFVRTNTEKDDLRNSLSLPVVNSFLAPFPQNLVALGESAAECDAAAPSHFSASLDYSDMAYEAGAPTTVLVTPNTPSPKITQRLREKKKSKSVYKHIPHREKPQHLVARRNARERRRVQSVNVAFSRLRRVVPGTSGRSKRVSKVKTLQGAMDYISHLQALLQEPPDLCDGDFPAMCTSIPYSAYAPSVRIQIFRDTANSMCDLSSVPDNEDMGRARSQPLESTSHSYGGTCWDDTEDADV